MSSVVLRGGTVVTMNATRDVVRGDLLLEDGRIAKIAERIDAPRGATVVDADGAIVLPGLVQAHVHLCQALFRGMADDLPLIAWLRERIWPFEAAHTEKSLYASARLGLAEMLRAGTTTILDMGTVRHQDAVFDAMKWSKIRGFSGKAMMDSGEKIPKGLRETTRESLRESEALSDRWHGASNGKLGYAFAPRFILSCSEKLLRETAELAASRDAIVHTHAAEHAEERELVRAALGKDDIAALESFGIAGPRAVLAHGVRLRPAEMRRMAKKGTRVVHCPSANLKLASGIADVVAMRAAGLVVAIGADGAPCNNRMDPWTEIRSAALLAKAKREDAAALPAMEALALATIDGARALGLDAEVGSLEVGKRADVIVVRRDALAMTPLADPVSSLVYAATPADVSDVFVEGEAVVRDGKLTIGDEAEIVARAREEAQKLRGRAKV